MKKHSYNNQNKNNEPRLRSQQQHGIHNSGEISFIDFGDGRIEKFYTVWKASPEDFDRDSAVVDIPEEKTVS